MARDQSGQNANNRWFLVQKRGAAGRVRHAPGLYKVIGDLEGLKGRALPGRGGAGSAPGIHFARAGGRTARASVPAAAMEKRMVASFRRPRRLVFAAVCLPLGRAAVTKEDVTLLLSKFTCPVPPHL